MSIKVEGKQSFDRSSSHVRGDCLILKMFQKKLAHFRFVSETRGGKGTASGCLFVNLGFIDIVIFAGENHVVLSESKTQWHRKKQNLHMSDSFNQQSGLIFSGTFRSKTVCPFLRSKDIFFFRKAISILRKLKREREGLGQTTNKKEGN